MNKNRLIQKAFAGAMFAFLFASSTSLFAQVKIGDNPTMIATGSALELESSNKGLRYSQVALTSTTVYAPILGSGTATTSPGMTVYNTNAGLTSSSTKYPANGVGEYYWDGMGWVYKNATTTPNLSVVWSANIGTTPQVMVGNTWTDVALTTMVYDKNNNYNLASKSYTVPAGGTGYYSIHTIFSTSPAAIQSGMYIGIAVNGVISKYVAIANCVAGAGMAGGGSGIFKLNAGDVVKVQYLFPYPTVTTGVNLSYLQFDMALVSI
ncbi:MAG TPA: hypothetical protein VGN64_16915 [Dyadobacter sp.]|nr:hypothetical protein [Dyadobacter sp.]